MKRLIMLILSVWMFTAANGANAIVLSTGLGGSDSETITDIELGFLLTFEYSFTEVIYDDGATLCLTAGFVLANAGFDECVDTTTGWLPGSIDTSGYHGLIDDLIFRATTSGDPDHSAVVEIRNIAVDGQALFPTPEPGTLTLLGFGLAGLGFTRRVKKTRAAVYG